MSPSNLVARLRASAWTSIFVRLVAIAAALAVLAWIGRAATANADAKVPVPVPLSMAVLDASAPEPAAAAAAAASSPPASPSSPSPLPLAARGRATPEDPVILNQADEAELRRLPGIGAKRAEAIVQLRRRVGRFSRVEDLMRVKGIGRAAVKKWKPLVRVDAAPPLLPVVDAGAP